MFASQAKGRGFKSHPVHEASVQILNRGKEFNEYTTEYLSSVNGNNDTDNNLRDLYNRGKRLEYMINRVNTELNEPDKSDVLKLIQNLKDREKSSLWIIRYLTAILLLRKVLRTPFRYCTKNVPIYLFLESP